MQAARPPGQAGCAACGIAARRVGSLDGAHALATVHARIASMSAHPALALPADRFAAVQMCAGDLQESLYRAALGPLNVQHYLAAFERLDAAGRVLPGWNRAAAMGTLAWMAFRGLWQALVLYASGLALLLLLALWALAQASGAIPAPVLGGLALAGLLPACALPGLYGDALVHRHARRRIDAALASQPTIADAIARLQRQAPSRAGLAWLSWLAAAGLAVVAALAAAAWLRLEGAGAGEDVAVAAVPAAAPAPVARPEQPSEPPASQALSALPGQAPADSSPPAEPPPPARTEPTPAPPAAAPVAAAVSVPASASAPASASTPAPAPAATGAAAADEARAPLEQARRLYVNVGLFAQPANAQRAYAQLLRAGLPSAVREVTAADGRRLRRVRVGPFVSAGEANAAAAQVRALGLDAAAASSD